MVRRLRRARSSGSPAIPVIRQDSTFIHSITATATMGRAAASTAYTRRIFHRSNGGESSRSNPALGEIERPGFLPSADVLIWPAASAPAWYPPGWAEIACYGIPEPAYQTEFAKIADSGYRPVSLDGYDVAGKTFFNVIFRANDGRAWIARHGLDGRGYQIEFDEWPTKDSASSTSRPI